MSKEVIHNKGKTPKSIPKELQENMRDPLWRIQNLYKIKDKSGNVIPFRLNKYQLFLYKRFHTRNIIPKARQLGVTTLMTIVYLDQVLFSKHKKAVIIAKDDTALKEIFRDKILFALSQLPDWAQMMFSETESQTQRQVVFANGSSIAVQTSARSGTVNFLHVSELGPIDAANPVKADEVVSGSLNATYTDYDSGNMITIESTSKGPQGHFYRICMAAEELRKARKENDRIKLSSNDYKIHFLPWHFADEYEDHTRKEIKEDTLAYFRSLSTELDMTFSEEKMRWWQFKKQEQGSDMEYEFPSTLDEAFSVKKIGIIYGEEMAQMFNDSRYRIVPYNPRHLVDTWWDLGVSDQTVIIFTQTIDSVIYVIDIYDDNNKGLKHYADILAGKPYKYHQHYLPWDGNKRDIGTARTPKQLLTDYGLVGIKVAPQASLEDGINNVKSLFNRFVINETNCHSLKVSLLTYRYRIDSTTGVSTGKPVHDKASHFADSLRTLGLMWRDYNSSVILNDEDQLSDEEMFQDAYSDMD